MGDLVEVEGEISEYYGLTEIALGNLTVLSSGNPLPAPEVLSTGDVSQEQWESVLVRVEDVTVSNEALGYGEWEVTDGADVALIHDMGSYTYVPSNGDSLNFVQGPLNYTYGAFKIEPRDDNDIGLRPPPVVDVNIDIKPGSASNPVNVHSKGVLPVAILGTEDFDVMTVNASTVRLTWSGVSIPSPPVGDVPPDIGVPPLRSVYEDVNRDGFMDLGLKYSMVAAGILTLTREASGPLDIMFRGELLDGTPIEGYDTVRIINKKYVRP
jgi:hypothetical protein